MSIQKNEVLECSDYSATSGYLSPLKAHQSFRKTLITVRRDFQIISAKTAQNLECCAVLSAGMLLTETQIEDEKRTRKITNRDPSQWYNTTTPFFSDQRMTKYASEMKVTLNPFSVYIPSLYYIATNKMAPNPDGLAGNKLHEFIIGHGHRKLGAHVFLNRVGCVFLVNLFMGDKVIGGLQTFTNTKVTSITSIYPVKRFEWDERPSTNPYGGTFLFGLDFRESDKKNHYKTGCRYYHRFGEQKITVGNVHELTMDRLNELRQSIPNRVTPTEATRYSVFYVCAGAKLVLLDRYHLCPTKHNRTLIQQGGIVVFQGSLYVSIPVLASPGDKKDTLNCKVEPWNEFRDKYLRDQKGELQTSAEDLVFFLGAQDSLHNTISWQIHIESGIDQPKRLVLSVTNNSRFTAIEPLTEGLEEINARIRYEVLHDSVITNHGIDFANCQLDMAKKIIDPGSGRACSAYSDFETRQQLVPDTNDTDMPREFNISQPLNQNFDENFTNFHTHQTSRLAVPPMYPTMQFLHIDEWEQTRIEKFWTIPSQEVQIRDMDELYRHSGRKIYLKHENKYYQGKHLDSTKAFHFRCLKETDMFNKTGHITENNCHYRLGVDGWVWKKDMGVQNPIYYQRMSYYEQIGGSLPVTLGLNLNFTRFDDDKKHFVDEQALGTAYKFDIYVPPPTPSTTPTTQPKT